MARTLKYDQIDRFPQAHYEVSIGWDYLEAWLEQQSEKGGAGQTLELDPDFQRMHVWTKDQQIRYCEFVIRGGESGRTIFWNHPNWMGSFTGEMTLVDGKQRLEAVRAFLRDEVPVFGDYRCSDLERRIMRLGRLDFLMRVAKLKTRSDVLKWYLMINAGGTPHTPEELDRVRALLAAEP
jgi:hypothetical protein